MIKKLHSRGNILSAVRSALKGTLELDKGIGHEDTAVVEVFVRIYKKKYEAIEFEIS